MKELINSLINWSSKIVPIFDFQIQWNSQNYAKLFMALLNEIQPHYFSQFDSNSNYDFNVLNIIIKKFYEEELNAYYPDIYQIHKQGDLKIIINMFKLIFGIGMRTEQEKMILCVIELDETDQKNLMPFIEEVKNLSNLSTYEQTYQEKISPTKLIEDLQKKEIENKQLKERNEELESRLKQLEYNYQIIKEDKNKIFDELNSIRNQKYQLGIELGLTTVNPTYGQILHRYRQKQYLYQMKIEQLEKLCQKKTILLQQKNLQMELLNKTYGSIKNSEDEITEKHKKEIENLNKRIETLNKKFEEKLKEQSREIMKQKQQVLEENVKLRQKISKLEKNYHKYKEFRKHFKNFQQNITPQMANS